MALKYQMVTVRNQRVATVTQQYIKFNALNVEQLVRNIEIAYSMTTLSVDVIVKK